MERPTLTCATVERRTWGIGGTEDDADEDTFEWHRSDQRYPMNLPPGVLLHSSLFSATRRARMSMSSDAFLASHQNPLLFLFTWIFVASHPRTKHALRISAWIVGWAPRSVWETAPREFKVLWPQNNQEIWRPWRQKGVEIRRRMQPEGWKPPQWSWEVNFSEQGDGLGPGQVDNEPSCKTSWRQ